MHKKLFGKFVESMTQMNEISRGGRRPSRQFEIDARTIKEVRAQAG
jgi:putative transcriptional regulator